MVDNWDDWFKFATLFDLIIFDDQGTRHDIGGVKIGQFGMPAGQYNRPQLPTTFDELDETFFSLGQDDSYYDKLNQLGDDVREKVLTGLHDVALDADLFERALKEDVTETSLLRSVSPATVRGQFRRMAGGGARLTKYVFSYTAPRERRLKGPPLKLTFRVLPESHPPTNVHVLIGRNGVGKTRLFRRMARSVLRSGGVTGAIEMEEVSDNEDTFEQTGALFTNLISVTFSAFDPFDEIPEDLISTSGVRYSYVGLHRPKSKEGRTQPPKSTRALATEFIASIEQCRRGAKSHRWLDVVDALGADPLFQEAHISELLSKKRGESDDTWEERVRDIFDKLSSGHKIVLLTTTRLVETVAEKSLVLIDEPEAHLHPPLLSAFLRGLSSLLVERNGVAVIATHSPVVLQEVPRTCVWKLRRTGAESVVERPDIETFGENVGVLTREVFGLEVTHAGFHTMLTEAVAENLNFEEVVDKFQDQLGAEAEAIVRGLVATRDAEH